eukprot:8700195-Pyramimonas_sp.AAC.1
MGNKRDEQGCPDLTDSHTNCRWARRCTAPSTRRRLERWAVRVQGGGHSRRRCTTQSSVQGINKRLYRERQGLNERARRGSS